MTKYLQIRHQDYWWSVYGYTKSPVRGVEFSITEDRAGEQFFFHLDIYTLPALEEEFLAPGEYIDGDNPSFPYFQNKAAMLRQGSIDYFVGCLYYEDIWPDMARCNQYQQDGGSIFSVTSPSRPPYYAVLFIREERSLLPELLIEWMKKISPSLFCEDFDFEIADIPSREDAVKSYEID